MGHSRLGMKVAPFVLMLVFLAGTYFAVDGPYILRQALGFYRTVVLARDIDTLRERKDLDRETEELFDRVEEIRRFAVEELGLEPSGNFTRYTEVERDHLATVVSVARDDRMHRGTWSYPVVGDLFYRGYYNTAHAVSTARELRARGHDVLIRQVDAFSSLGYFSDPVYSFMKDYDDYRLANLIIHEEVHANVWIDGKNAYNEEIATFVGDEGAALFVREKYGAESEEYEAVAQGREDRRTYRAWLDQVYYALTDAYRILETREERLNAKERIFAEAREKLKDNYDDMFETDRYRGAAEQPLNNARVDAGYHYGGDLSLYYGLYDELGYDLPKMVELIRRTRLRPDAPREFLVAQVEKERATSSDSGPTESHSSGLGREQQAEHIPDVFSDS